MTTYDMVRVFVPGGTIDLRYKTRDNAVSVSLASSVFDDIDAKLDAVNEAEGMLAVTICGRDDFGTAYSIQAQVIAAVVLIPAAATPFVSISGLE